MPENKKRKYLKYLPRFLRTEKLCNKDDLNKNATYCTVHLLDESVQEIQLKANWKGFHLLEKVCDLLNLNEKDYFGLRFVDSSGQAQWLDGNKAVLSQLKSCNALSVLYFGVKFYAADPCKLKDEMTRYLFFLQVRRDIWQGRLPVTFDTEAELSACVVLSEMGSFDERQCDSGYLSDLRLVPNQTDDFESRVATLHRQLGNMDPGAAEYRFLDKVKWLDMYGVDLHLVLGEGKMEYFLGVAPTGIMVCRNQKKSSHYYWPRISKLMLNGKTFAIKVKGRNNEKRVCRFEVPRMRAAKHLLKCCKSHQAFFSNQCERKSGQNSDRPASLVVRRPSSRRQRGRVNSGSTLSAGKDVGQQQDQMSSTSRVLLRPEPVNKRPHCHSLTALDGDRFPIDVLSSAPWETTADRGLYTCGGGSVKSDRSSVRFDGPFTWTGSDSETGSSVDQRRKYFPNRRVLSDNDSDVSVTRRMRRRSNCHRQKEADGDSVSDVSSRLSASATSETAMFCPFYDAENHGDGSLSSVQSALTRGLRQKRRRRRSKSPGSNRLPVELKQHFEYNLKDTKGKSAEELREIQFINVETKSDTFKLKYSPKLRMKVKAAKQKSFVSRSMRGSGGADVSDGKKYGFDDRLLVRQISAAQRWPCVLVNQQYGKHVSSRRSYTGCRVASSTGHQSCPDDVDGDGQLIGTDSCTRVEMAQDAQQMVRVPHRKSGVMDMVQHDATSTYRSGHTNNDSCASTIRSAPAHQRAHVQTNCESLSAQRNYPTGNRPAVCRSSPCWPQPANGRQACEQYIHPVRCVSLLDQHEGVLNRPDDTTLTRPNGTALPRPNGTALPWHDMTGIMPDGTPDGHHGNLPTCSRSKTAVTRPKLETPVSVNQERKFTYQRWPVVQPGSQPIHQNMAPMQHVVLPSKQRIEYQNDVSREGIIPGRWPPSRYQGEVFLPRQAVQCEHRILPPFEMKIVRSACPVRYLSSSRPFLQTAQCGYTVVPGSTGVIGKTTPA